MVPRVAGGARPKRSLVESANVDVPQIRALKEMFQNVWTEEQWRSIMKNLEDETLEDMREALSGNGGKAGRAHRILTLLPEFQRVTETEGCCFLKLNFRFSKIKF